MYPRGRLICDLALAKFSKDSENGTKLLPEKEVLCADYEVIRRTASDDGPLSCEHHNINVYDQSCCNDFTPVGDGVSLNSLNVSEIPIFIEADCEGKKTIVSMECVAVAEHNTADLLTAADKATEACLAGNVVDTLPENDTFPGCSVVEHSFTSADKTNETICPVNNICAGRPKKGRKRKFESQVRADKKKKVNTNQDYISVNGEMKYCKEFRDYHCLCKLKCHEIVSVEQRQAIFYNYWNAGSYEARCQILMGMLMEKPVGRKRVKGSLKRNFTRVYYLGKHQVCKPTFLQTLRVSSCVIQKAVDKLRDNGIVADGRGSAGGHNKLPENKVQEVIEHISKFPKYKSHYCRSETSSEFLNPHVTLKVMYDLYCSEYKDPVSQSMYKKLFLTKFNLRRKTLKKDTCNLCDSLKVETNMRSTDENEILKEKHTIHLKEAELARNTMNKNFTDAKSDKSKHCISFDLEKTLPLPRIPTNIVFYKRQLWFYNCGIHSSNDKGFCFTWVEGDAGRGAQEVGSCLKVYVRENVPPQVRNLILWSDSCGGQNRNIKIVLMLKSILEEHQTLETITQRFLVPGHSFLKNDSDFSDIECALKLQQRIYLPSDYVTIIKGCRTKNPLIVHEMKSEEFLSTVQLEKLITNRKLSVTKQKMNWLKFKEIQVRKSDPFSIFVKTDLNQDYYSEIFIGKGKRQKENVNSKVYSTKLTPLWPEGKPVSLLKLQDLKSMFHLIPKDCWSFYKNLCSSSAAVDDVEGFSGEPDFEIQDDYQ